MSVEDAVPADASGDFQVGESTIENNTMSMLGSFQEPPAGGDGPSAAMDAPGSPASGAGGAGAGAAADSAANTVTTLNATKLESKPDDKLIKVKGLDKQQLCIDLLMVGCVQSFVDFFYITHRKTPPNENNLAESEAKDVVIPEETLMFLKETLEVAESARRSSNYQHCFESYNTLAEYFEKVPDLKSSMYFYQRCADVASEVDARKHR